MKIEEVRMADKDDFDEAADDLIEAANYLKDHLDAGKPVLESKWLGAVMRAHEMLLAAADDGDN
jgi:DNA-binding phage protein